MMQISDAGLSLIKAEEGYHRARPDGACEAYRCPAGVWTIGWGCTSGVTPGMVWTREQAEAALRHELARFEAAVLRLVTVPLNQHQLDALVSFAFNVGEGALAGSTLLRKLNAGDLPGAAAEFARWNRGGGRVLPGLVRRRAAEATLFLRPVAKPDIAAPDMPQAVAPPAEVASPIRSGTIWGSLMAGAGGVLAYLEDGVKALLEVVAQVQTMDPVKAMLATVAGNTRALALSIIVGAVTLVIGRRLKARQEGKPG